MFKLVPFPHLESGDSLSNGDKLARVVGEHLGDLEGLGQEPLNLPRPRDLDLVLQITSVEILSIAGKSRN